jgi:signal transduction histidine kinase
MNHELRTPLNTVIGFAETLVYDAAQSQPDPQLTQEFALQIRDAGRQLLALIDDILDFVRIDSGSYELAADTIDAARLVQAAVRGAGEAAREARLALSSRDETAAIRLSADERRLRRLLGHLLGNAIKFTPSGGAIAVVSRLSEAGDLCIEVHDNGIGMSPEDLKRALQPFDQLDARHARRAGGAGIGLYLSRAIAEAHDGALRLESAPGVGTTATLVLPRARLLEPTPSLKLAQELP